jgi:hypothetical protein
MLARTFHQDFQSHEKYRSVAAIEVAFLAHEFLDPKDSTFGVPALKECPQSKLPEHMETRDTTVRDDIAQTIGQNTAFPLHAIRFHSLLAYKPIIFCVMKGALLMNTRVLERIP